MTARQPSLLRCFLRLKVRLAINWIGSKNHKIFLTITVNFTNQENSLLLSDREKYCARGTVNYRHENLPNATGTWSPLEKSNAKIKKRRDHQNENFFLMVATPLVSAEPDSVPTTLFGALVVKIKKDLGGRSRETMVKWWKALTRDHSDGNVLLVLAILLVSVERDLGLTALCRAVSVKNVKASAEIKHWWKS